MKVSNTELLEFLEAIYSDLIGLIMLVIVFREAIATRFPAKAQYHPEILQHLSNSVWGQLMQLDSEFEQNLSESRMRQHLQSHGKKVFKDNNFVEVRLRHRLFPQLTRRAFSKVP
jgi:hypothetical protein